MTVLDEAPGQVVLEEELFLAGRDRPAASGATYDVHNPYSRAVLARVPDAGAEDMEQAILAARQSFEDGVWADRHPRDRAAVLARAVAMLTAQQETLAELETANLGAPIRNTTNLLVGGAVLFADELADLAGRDLTESRPLQTSPSLAVQMIRHLPVGVVGAITPWNFPLLSAVFKVFPALAAGNSVVLKPSPLCPLTSLRLARILRDAGLPDGVLSVVTGKAPELGAVLTSHPEVDMVSFTGSCEVGRLVAMACADNYKRFILELGGKSPVTVLPGSDYDLTVDACLFAVFMNSGQFCEAGSRLLVPAAEYDDFVERLVARTATITLGDPQDWDTDLGPLVSGAQRERVLGFIAAGKADGAELLIGGGAPDLPGWFVEPTIFGRVRNDMHVAREEVFGPVLCVIPYADLDEALRIANDTPYGLAAGVFGSDYVEAVDYASRLRAGTVWINDYHQVSPHMPFGGFKRSGIGREMGFEGIRAYTETQSFHVDLARKREQKFYGLVCSAE